MRMFICNSRNNAIFSMLFNRSEEEKESERERETARKEWETERQILFTNPIVMMALCFLSLFVCIVNVGFAILFMCSIIFLSLALSFFVELGFGVLYEKC